MSLATPRSPTSTAMTSADSTHLQLRLSLLLRALSTRNVHAHPGAEENNYVRVAWPTPRGEAYIHVSALGPIECFTSDPSRGGTVRFLASTIPDAADWASRVSA